jgi:adenylate cyclase
MVDFDRQFDVYVLTVQNRVEIHRKRMGDLVLFSPRKVSKVCQSKDQKQTAKVLYLTYRSNPM